MKLLSVLLLILLSGCSSTETKVKTTSADIESHIAPMKDMESDYLQDDDDPFRGGYDKLDTPDLPVDEKTIYQWDRR